MSNPLYERAVKKYGTKVFDCIISKQFNLGECPICNQETVFLKLNEWLRDYYVCPLCDSIPRHRAVIKIINALYPDFRETVIHESSPCGAASDKLKMECKNYSFSHYFSECDLGSFKEGIRCENLEEMTFKDNTFDMFITQDVLEHVLNPDKAFKEIKTAAFR